MEFCITEQSNGFDEPKPFPNSPGTIHQKKLEIWFSFWHFVFVCAFGVCFFVRGVGWLGMELGLPHVDVDQADAETVDTAQKPAENDNPTATPVDEVDNDEIIGKAN